MIKIAKILIIFLFVLLVSPVHAKEIKDFFDRKITIPKDPKRIISLSPATTEILYSVGAEGKIIAVTEDCNFPENAKTKEKIGKFGNISYEKILLLKPDIIFATKDMGKTLDGLKRYNFPIIATDTQNINDIFDNIETLGKFSNNQSKSKSNVALLKQKLLKINERNLKIKLKPSVFYVVWNDPIMTSSENSFIGDMIKIAGGNNIVKNIKQPFVKYSIESLVSKNPDYLIIPNSTFKKTNLKIFPWNKLKAVKNNKVIIVDDDRYLRPGPRIIDSIEELQEKLYSKKL